MDVKTQAQMNQDIDRSVDNERAAELATARNEEESSQCDELSSLFDRLRVQSTAMNEVPAVLEGSLADHRVEVTQLTEDTYRHGLQQWINVEEIPEVVNAEIDEVLERLENEVYINETNQDEEDELDVDVSDTGNSSSSSSAEIEDFVSYREAEDALFILKKYTDQRNNSTLLNAYNVYSGRLRSDRLSKNVYNATQSSMYEYFESNTNK